MTLHGLLNVSLISWTKVLEMIKIANTTDVEEVDDMGSKPLDRAIQLHAPVDVIQALVERAPTQVEYKHPISGDIPLLTACHPCHADRMSERLKIHTDSRVHKIISCLLQAFPGAVLKKTQDGGMTPLHVLMQHRPPLALVEEMLDKIATVGSVDDVLMTRDDEDQNPLHVAIEHHAPTAIILCLIEACQESVMQTGNRELPLLHHAIFSGTSKAVLDSLLKIDSSTILNQKNKLKKNALQMAFDKRVSRWETSQPEGEETSPEGVIQDEPMDLMSLKDAVELTLKHLPKKCNVFEKGRDMKGPTKTAWGLYAEAMKPVVADAKKCFKRCRHPPPDLTSLIKTLERIG